MHTSRLAAVVVGMGTVGALIVGSTDAVALTATTTTMFRHSQDAPGVMGVAGIVSPAPGTTPRVVVSLFKKASDGSWTLRDKRRAAWGDASGEGRTFTASMQHAPAKGTCKLVAKYPGNDTYAKSRDKDVIDCKTGATKGGTQLPATG
jgi:hypothetical protein